jgi:hypothetical protein
VSEFLDDDQPEKLGVDVVGIGSGVFDRLQELGYSVFPVNVGAGPSDDENKEKFYNLRAEVFWQLRERFKPDGNGRSNISIPDDQELVKELSEIRYSFSSERKIRIQSKDEMKQLLGRSPDKADALSLAFYNVPENEPQMVIV